MQYKLEKPVQGRIGTEKYQCAIEWRNGKLIADEPVKSGDSGPDPFTLFIIIACFLYSNYYADVC